MTIPIIDLFAGPGGLGEGFAALRDREGMPVFQLGVSIEKDESAFRTLALRSVYRRLAGTPSVRHYYDYVRGDLSVEAFRGIPAVAQAYREASEEAHQFELGRTSEALVDARIRAALNGTNRWVLIGGPPCQAYSLAGRARRVNDATFASDVKHFLYREYLRILRKHRPAVFVMENVKGLLSSTHSGKSMFGRIIEDLSAPHDGVEYEVRSLVVDADKGPLAPEDYLVQAELYGVPQSRHRVIMLGIRRGEPMAHRLLRQGDSVSVAQAIDDLPKIRSKVSKPGDSHAAWHASISSTAAKLREWNSPLELPVRVAINAAVNRAGDIRETGARFIPAGQVSVLATRPEVKTYRRWIVRPKLGGVLQHETRSHMDADLNRYMFAACFAKKYRVSPRLQAYPPKLLPEHKNVLLGEVPPFPDRFRVQLDGEPSSTIVSHIAKDGHYYIHYDAAQCRSLTVREAARLQSFPDDYFFEGNRTQQYTQVGNAVPPLLANQIASIVAEVLALSAGAHMQGVG
jgi:DNA (cytosine-5)-methyltransferase 1